MFAPDSNIYVTEQGANAIARLNPRTGQATDIPIPTPESGPQSGALGPDGAIWFVERSADKIGRITTHGALTEYPIEGGPVGITVGRDRQLYVDLFTAGAVARVNLEGHVTGQWALPAAVGPLQITTGFGLDIWVTDTSGGDIYRLTPYAESR